MSEGVKFERIITENRRARYEYQILETIECGIALFGSEVKSIRNGAVSLNDGYVMIKNNEAFLFNVHIAPYNAASRFNPDPRRTRKLLLHKKEIHRLLGKQTAGKLTIIPLRIYLKSGKIKIEIALVKGKKLYDKRAAIKQRELNREKQNILRLIR
ncbi:MAG: SsrA-binding protein SmpB [bacterium]|nr:SsrA-binding protein SmpB [bacterium]